MKKLHVFFIVILLILTCVATGLFYLKKYVAKKETQAVEITEFAREIFLKKAIGDTSLIIQSGAESTDYTAAFPLRHNADSLKGLFAEIGKKYPDARVTIKEINTDSAETVNAKVEFDDEILFKARFIRSKKPKIAVLIDDWGYKEAALPYLATIKQPFTVAILPDLAWSKKVAEKAAAEKKSVIIHMPMQPQKNMPVEKGTVKVSMGEDEIDKLVLSAISGAPGAVGLNNHEGSLATEKQDTMNALMKVLKLKNMFFVDSLTTPKTVAMAKAKENGVLSMKRDIFLDNEKKAAYIKSQFEKLKKVAKSRGYAVGIGHAIPETLKVLSEVMPEAEAQGYEFVLVGMVVN